MSNKLETPREMVELFDLLVEECKPYSKWVDGMGRIFHADVRPHHAYPAYSLVEDGFYTFIRGCHHRNLLSAGQETRMAIAFREDKILWRGKTCSELRCLSPYEQEMRRE